MPFDYYGDLLPAFRKMHRHICPRAPRYWAEDRGWLEQQFCTGYPNERLEMRPVVRLPHV
jgi:hypothetical protein